MAELTVRDLTVVYRGKRTDVTALDGVDASFPDGINVILGYSGCGKTTLLRALLGLVPATGEILFEGRPLNGVSVAERGFSYVPQDHTLYPQCTIFENIAFPLRRLGAGREEITERVRAIAERLGLTACLTRKPRHISIGQQQRAAIARALVRDPAVCLLDEPFSAMDEEMRVSLRQWMRRVFHASGCMALYVTHDVRCAMALADHIYVMDEGRFLLSGTPEAVWQADCDVMRCLKEASGLV